VPENVILVADVSSDFVSRPIDISKHGVVFAGAQKNAGISGVTIVIVRDDLLNRALPITPTSLSYKIFAENKSLYNTPSTFGIYVSGLMFKWILEKGGIKGIESLNLEKANKINSVIGSSDFWRPTVNKEFRSKMNVTLRLKDQKLESVFIKEASEQGLIELSGHRSVGGIRISLYNAIPIEAVDTLIQFMNQFQQIDDH
jgi:phosphoserine aminotransferase